MRIFEQFQELQSVYRAYIKALSVCARFISCTDSDLFRVCRWKHFFDRLSDVDEAAAAVGGVARALSLPCGVNALKALMWLEACSPDS